MALALATTQDKPKDETKWTAFPDERGIEYRKRKERGRVKMEYRARITVIVDGERQQRTRKATSRGDARQARLDLIRESQEPEKVEAPLPRSETLTFAELAEQYAADCVIPPVYDDEHSDDRNKQAGIAEKSVQDSKRALEVFKAAFGSTLVKEIKKHDVQKWKIARFQVPKARGGGKRSLANVHRELAVLRAAFGYAIEHGYVDRNPVRGLIKQKQEKKRDRILSFEEIAILLPASSDSLRSLLIFMLQTAARVGEALQVERRDIDLNDGIVTLRKIVTKEKKEPRELPITPELREVMVQRLAEMPDDPHALLFEKTYDSYEGALQNALKQAGLTNIHFHDCRRTWITNAVPSGIPLPDAMKISGHYVVETFMRYYQQTKESHRVNAGRYGMFWQQGIQAAQAATAFVN
jgi:integrase